MITVEYNPKTLMWDVSNGLLHSECHYMENACELAFYAAVKVNDIVKVRNVQNQLIAIIKPKVK
jgi:hypothetical protein